MLAEVPSDNERLKATGLGYLLYGGYTALTRLQMRFGFWDEAIKDLQVSNQSPQTLSEKYQAGILSYLKGMSAVERSNAEEANKHALELEKVIQDLSAQKVAQASDWYFNYANRILAVHILDLRGSILSVEGKHDEAVKLLNEAIEKEKNLGYWEPPHYTRPVLESLGAASSEPENLMRRVPLTKEFCGLDRTAVLLISTSRKLTRKPEKKKKRQNFTGSF